MYKSISNNERGKEEFESTFSAFLPKAKFWSWRLALGAAYAYLGTGILSCDMAMNEAKNNPHASRSEIEEKFYEEQSFDGNPILENFMYVGKPLADNVVTPATRPWRDLGYFISK